MSIGSDRLMHVHAPLVIALLMLSLLVASGCGYFYDQFGEVKRIPSPISENYPFEVDGNIYRVWRSNELQIKNDEHTCYLILQGVNNPDMKEAIEQQAIEAVHALLTEPLVKATVHATDDQNRFVGQVRCGDSDVNLEILKQGWGQWDGTEFDRTAEFKQAEADAKASKLGIWGLGDE